jgi:hypothetical protein
LVIPSRRQAIVEWHARLPTNIRQTVNHPTKVWRRYMTGTAVPRRPRSPSQNKNEIIAVQEEGIDELERQTASDRPAS